MISNESNKMMGADDGVTFKAVSGMMYDFFFPGSGKWKPVSVRAESREVAQQLWEQNRQPINPEPIAEATAEKEEKVDDIEI